MDQVTALVNLRHPILNCYQDQLPGVLAVSISWTLNGRRIHIKDGYEENLADQKNGPQRLHLTKFAEYKTMMNTV